ncbi:hypothetical protein [Bradyrhizobium sp. ORS 111]|uniref:hypothetical protein n=1 Tax=Bradyrhizobium sp. ORS 111 TaxID=1685958 RepID=UPI00388D2195
MPIAGQGMLLTSMDVDSLHEAEFNRWYDREHIEERVAIEGFIEARRYVAHDGRPKYLSLYSTATFDVLDSPAYRAALANQTEWSKANIARFKNMIRGVARITISRGTGRGAALGIIRLRPPEDGADKLREVLQEQLDPSALDGIISMHLLENDPALSRPLTPDAAKADPGAGDWYVLIDATDVDAVPAAAARIIDNIALKPLVVTSGVYRLLWDLAKSDLPRK